MATESIAYEAEGYTKSPVNNFCDDLPVSLFLLCFSCRIFIFTGISVWCVFVSTGSPKNKHLTEEELFRIVIRSVSRFFRVNSKNILRSIFTAELMTPLANKLP